MTFWSSRAEAQTPQTQRMRDQKKMKLRTVGAALTSSSNLGTGEMGGVSD